MQIREIIRELGGTKKVAVACGVSEPNVSMWKKRGSIPAEHWMALVTEAERLGSNNVNYALLAQLHAKSQSDENSIPTQA
jgi:hypothetical protein